jgi:hypothetical protein
MYILLCAAGGKRKVVEVEQPLVAEFEQLSMWVANTRLGEDNIHNCRTHLGYDWNLNVDFKNYQKPGCDTPEILNLLWLY